MNHELTLHEAIVITLRRRDITKQQFYRMLKVNDNHGAELMRGHRSKLEPKAAAILNIDPSITTYNLSLAEACLLYRLRNNLTIPALNRLWKSHYAGHLEAGFTVPHKHLVAISEKLGYTTTLPTVPVINSGNGVQYDGNINQ